MSTQGGTGNASGRPAGASKQGAENTRVVNSGSPDPDADARTSAHARPGGPNEAPGAPAGAPGGAGPPGAPVGPPGAPVGPPGAPVGPPVWHDVYEVSSFWADMTGHAYPHGILEMMQDSAWRHAEALGLGYSHLDEESLLWVLSRLDVHITRMPQWGETVRLETWPTGTHRLFALREFCLYDDDERELLRANSAWLVLDGESRKPRKPGPVVDRRNIPINPGNYNSGPGKIYPPGDEDGRYALRTRYSDIDPQRHVNNARYVDWMLNGLPDDWMDTRRPRELSVNFLRECAVGDSVEIMHEHDADSRQERTRHSVVLDGRPVCVMTAVWAAR